MVKLSIRFSKECQDLVHQILQVDGILETRCALEAELTVARRSMKAQHRLTDSVKDHHVFPDGTETQYHSSHIGTTRWEDYESEYLCIISAHRCKNKQRL